jgi:hypothetical protein
MAAEPQTFASPPSSTLEGLTTPEALAASGLIPGKTDAPAIRRMARLGHFPEGAVVKIGRRTYLRKSVLERWLRGEL